jgi:3-oxoadipate enol-lactonase
VNTFARLRPEKSGDLIYFASRMLIVYTLGLSTQARMVANRLFPDPEQEELRQELIKQINQADPKGYRAAMRALGRFDVESQLSEIQAPTLVVTGERDTTVPLKLQQNLAQGIANARHVVIPDAGHAVTADKPQVFNEILMQFLLNSGD